MTAGQILTIWLGEVKKLITEKKSAEEQDSAAKVQKLAEQRRFRLKEAMAQRGNSEAFLHWLQTDTGKKA